MSPPPDPPPPDWDAVSGTCAEFVSAQNAAQKYGFDSTNLAILDSTGTPNYLYFGKSTVTTGHVAWFFRNASNGGNAPYAKVPSATFNVISGGTINASTGVITYQSTNYRLDIRVDGSGRQVAYALAV